MTDLNDFEERLQRLERIIPELETALECLSEIKPILDAAIAKQNVMDAAIVEQNEPCVGQADIPFYTKEESSMIIDVPSVDSSECNGTQSLQANSADAFTMENARRLAAEICVPYDELICQKLAMIATLQEHEQDIYLEVLGSFLPTVDGMRNVLISKRQSIETLETN